jgi:TolA-binding protein
MRTVIAGTGVVLALILAGCKDDPAPVAGNTGQTSQQAAGASANALASPNSNPAVPSVAPPSEASRAVATQGVEPRHPAKVARAATRSVGAGIRAHVDLFYDELERYGTWARHPDFSYVWLPARQGGGWRPYQEGRWIWTDDYGWYWESSEPFAWAVYHYGRWDYDPEFGWFWIPGDTWAPAWVTWRQGGGHTGWAPIAPDRKGYAAGIPHRIKSPVLESWIFVEDRNFADPNLGRYVVPIRQIGAVLDIAQDLGGPVYENGVVINRGLRREQFERAAGSRVETRQIVYVRDEADAFDDVRGARIGIYRPTIETVEVLRSPRAAVNDVSRVDRVMIREYAEARVSGLPSVALLAVLDSRERRSLQDDRLTREEAAVDREIERLQQERAALLEERRREAERLQVQIEQERQEGIRQRMQEQQRLLEQRRQRAEAIGTIETEPRSTQPAPLPMTQPVPPPMPAIAPAAAPPQSAAVLPPLASATAPPSAEQAVPPSKHVVPPASARAPSAEPGERFPATATPPEASLPSSLSAPTAPTLDHVSPPAPPADGPGHRASPQSATAPGETPARHLPPPATATAPPSAGTPPTQHVPPPAPLTPPAVARDLQGSPPAGETKATRPAVQNAASPSISKGADEETEPEKPVRPERQSRPEAEERQGQAKSSDLSDPSDRAKTRTSDE